MKLSVIKIVRMMGIVMLELVIIQVHYLCADMVQLLLKVIDYYSNFNDMNLVKVTEQHIMGNGLFTVA